MRVLFNHSDTNPTNLRHPEIKDCSRLHTTCGASWTTTAPIHSSTSTWVQWWTLLSITVRSGDTNSKDVMVHVTREFSIRLAHKNSAGDGKPRQVVNTTMRFKHERHKDPYKPSEHDEKSVKTNTTTCMGRGQDARSLSRERTRNTDEPLARICAATDITSTDLSFKNFHVESYTVPSKKNFQNPREA